MEASLRESGVSRSWERVLVYTPFLLLGGSFLLLLPRATRPAMLWLLEEDHPVETLTFVFLFAGSVVGLGLARRLRRRGEPFRVWGFYLVFSIGLFLVAGDEIAWGQRVFGFGTPEAIREINRQGETTFHNIGDLQGRSEWLRLAFGIGGIVGVALSSRPAFARVGAPSLLLPWFLLISVHAAIDAWNDYFPIQPRFDFTMQRTSEMVELLIGMAGFLYVFLNRRELEAGRWPWDAKTKAP
jgi:hypothetical protein